MERFDTTASWQTFKPLALFQRAAQLCLLERSAPAAASAPPAAAAGTSAAPCRCPGLPKPPQRPQPAGCHPLCRSAVPPDAAGALRTVTAARPASAAAASNVSPAHAQQCGRRHAHSLPVTAAELFSILPRGRNRMLFTTQTCKNQHMCGAPGSPLATSSIAVWQACP